MWASLKAHPRYAIPCLGFLMWRDLWLLLAGTQQLLQSINHYAHNMPDMLNDKSKVIHL